MTQSFTMPKRSFADRAVAEGLAQAVAEQDALAMRFFISAGQDKDARDNNGMTLLQIAAAEGKNKSVLGLLIYEASTTLTGGPAGYAALHFAVYADNPVGVKHIASESKNPDVRDRSGNTALHLAAYMGRMECCFNLLRCGANIHAKNSVGQTAKEIVLQRIEELSEWTDKAKYQPLARLLSTLEENAAQGTLRHRFLESCIRTAMIDMNAMNLAKVPTRAPRRFSAH